MYVYGPCLIKERYCTVLYTVRQKQSCAYNQLFAADCMMYRTTDTRDSPVYTVQCQGESLQEVYL